MWYLIKYLCYLSFWKFLTFLFKEFGLIGIILDIIKTMYATPKLIKGCMQEKLMNLLAQKYDLSRVMCSLLFSSTFM